METRRLTFAGAMLALLCLVAVACNSPENRALTKRSSSGKTCEVLIAINKVDRTGEVREALAEILAAPQEGLPQPERRFDTIYIPVSSLKNTEMFRHHRNIIMCDVKESNADKIYVHHNQWAEPQVVIDIVASGDSSLAALLRSHAGLILEELYKAEHERIARAFHNDRNVELMRRVRDTFGFGIVLPQDFTWAANDADFAWLRKETKDFGLGILIHTMPYRDGDQFDTNRIHNRLDTVMRRNVAGPADGSYMGTERRVELTSRKVDFEGSDYCIETRGLWRLFGDFMGGPFVSYCILSPDRKQIVELTGYVYCPRFDKRDLLMQVDGICRSLRWDETNDK